MPHRLLVALAVALLWATAPAAVFAQGLPEYPSTEFSRGPGFYISFTKLGLFLFVFLVWVRTVTWINLDSRQQKLETGKWNSIAFFAGMAGMILVFLVPWFLLGFPLLLAACIVPLGLYARTRNADLPPHERVLTLDHIQFWLKLQLRRIGIKTKSKTSPEAQGVSFKAKGGDKQTNQANLIKSRQSPTFPAAQQHVQTALNARADSILMDLTRQGMTVRHQVDGLWENGEPTDMETGLQVYSIYKTLANLNPQEQRQQQAGRFEIRRGNLEYVAHLTTQGTQTGERLLMKIEQKGAAFKALDDLGMAPEMRDRVVQLLSPGSKGVFVFCSLPGNGLTTTIDVTMHSIDRFQRSWVSVEDKNKPEHSIENVDVKTFDSHGGESPASILPKIIREYPDAYVIRNLVGGETLKLVLGEGICGDDKVVVTSTAAKEAVEAPLRILTLKDDQGQPVPPAALARYLIGVLNVRLIRKLCTECRQAFEPPPDYLQRLGLAPGSVQFMYRHSVPDPEDPKSICQTCGGRGFLGRTGLFELVIMNDRMRQVLAKSPKLDVMRAEARKAGMRNLQEEGIRLVAQGITSIEELQRVLKQ